VGGGGGLLAGLGVVHVLGGSGLWAGVAVAALAGTCAVCVGTLAAAAVDRRDLMAVVSRLRGGRDAPDPAEIA
jgi:putative peptidoglycan lipid II flippase